MSRLFKRAARLTLSRPRGDGPGGFFTQESNAVVVEQPRITFSVEKSLSSKPNTASIAIFNLAEQARAAFAVTPLHVRLEAGHDGEYAQVFAGDLRWGRSAPDGTEWVTTLEASDGGRAHVHARVSRSFKAGVDKRKALAELADTMGLKLPSTVDDARELLDQFQAGVTLQGPSAREMDRLAKSAGFEWSVQDGSLVMLRASDVRPGEAYVVSQDTGMIGSPEFGTPAKKGEPATLTARMLLAPQVGAGMLLKLDTRAIRGLFRTERVLHSGDTHGGDWVTEVEAKPR